MRCLLGLVLAVTLTALCSAQDKPYTRTEDVVYGRKFGMSLTMDVFTPKKDANGAAVIWAVSGGWVSAKEAIRPEVVESLLERGYTVFAVTHGCQPRYTIPECVADMQRSVRFIRHNAERFKIDPERIGVTGASAGGHLSLMLGTTGDEGNAKSPDVVERESSRVQAVACFFPPTDFLNYGQEGEVALGTGVLKDFAAPFDFHEFSGKTKRYERIEEPSRRLEIGKSISPVTHITKDDAPTLIIHGDADKLVPIQQAQRFIDKYKETGLTGELITKKGAAHGWATFLTDVRTFADWFDKNLEKK